jgi:hypothetical protein
MAACATATTNGDESQDSGTGIVSSSSSGSGGSSSGILPSSSGGSGSIQSGSGGGGDSGSIADGYFFTEAGSPTNPCPILSPTCGADASALCTDLPTTHYIDTSNGATTPPNAESQFSGTPATTGGPCILEPSDGTLIPQNWLRPRIRFTPGAGQTLFQIRIHADNQANDLYVYTTNTTWTLWYQTWEQLTQTTVDQDITLTVTGLGSGGSASSTAKFRIAPATAGGTMIYWAAAGECAGQAWLEGFNIGDETVASVLTPSQARWYTPQDGYGNALTGDAGAIDCIGCHSGVPDGDGGVGHSVAFLNSWEPPGNLGWPGIMASVDPDAGIGSVPSWVTPGGKQAFNQPWLGLAAFSADDWQTEHIAISSYGQQLNPTACNAATYQYQGCPYQAAGTASPNQKYSSLAWFDLSSTSPEVDAGGNGSVLGAELYAEFGTSWGFLTRTGDANAVEFPAWSRDGKTVAYVSTNAGQDGRLGSETAGSYTGGIADIYTVPYNNRQGGTATPVAGASDPSWSEFYPSFSTNDQYIAFTRAPSTEDMYYNSHDEVYVVPSGGAATPTRLAANDPPACSGFASPGVANSWPKWSPDVQTCPNGLTYYWIVFSSARDGIPWGTGTRKYNDSKAPTEESNTSHLYLAGMTVNQSTGEVRTYPALYIWNQPSATSQGLPICTSETLPDGGAALGAGVPQSNHTPIWQDITIEQPPPPEAGAREPPPK